MLKKIPHPLNQWDEEERCFLEMAPGPSCEKRKNGDMSSVFRVFLFKPMMMPRLYSASIVWELVSNC
jgi:hypothetical protein